MFRRHQNFQLIGSTQVLVRQHLATGMSRYVATLSDNKGSASGFTPEAAVSALLRRLAVQQACES